MWPLRAWGRISAAFEQMHRRAVAQRELRSIDEATMRDIGLSHRAAAEWWCIREEASGRESAGLSRLCSPPFAVHSPRSREIIGQMPANDATSRTQEAMVVLAVAIAAAASAIALVMRPLSLPSPVRPLPPCESRLSNASPEGATTHAPHTNARNNHDTTHSVCA
jgi:hypothetical protein